MRAAALAGLTVISLIAVQGCEGSANHVDDVARTARSGRPDQTSAVDHLPGPAIPSTAIADDPRITGLSAAPGGVLWIAVGGRLLMSYDDGASWSDLVGLPGRADDVTFVDTSTGWISTGSRLYVTRDGGRAWKDISPRDVLEIDDIRLLDAEFGWVEAGPGGYVKTGPGAFVTADGGATWSRLDSPCGLVTFFHRQSGWAVCGINGAGSFELKELYRTDDGGRSWQLLARAVPPGHTTPTAHFIPLNGHARSLFALDESHAWMAGGRESIWRTTDGFKSATRGGTIPFLDGTYDDIVFVSATRGYVIDDAHAALRTDDGGDTWCWLHAVGEYRQGTTYAQCE